jgi:nucleoside-diphosphate-sugar epimerase
MSGKRVLLTGAAGKVGRYVVPQLAAQGYTVFATDLVELPAHIAALPGVNFIRCDLTDADAVGALVSEAQADVLLHTAAIVAPISYACTDLAYRVNVAATSYLLAASARQSSPPHVVFCSSYTVHGPCPPGSATWNAQTPYAPADNYTCQKVSAERQVRQYAGSWSILRIGGVFDADQLMPAHRSYKPFAFMVPLAQREHGVDVQDVATALVHSARVCPHNRILMIGGDSSWQLTALDIRRALYRAMGLAPVVEAYREPHSDAGWYYENWMDTREAQRLLDFQNHSFDDFIVRVRAKSRLMRLLGPVISLLAGKKLVQDSPYLGEKAIGQGETLWDDINSVYGIDDRALVPGLEVEQLSEAAQP